MGLILMRIENTDFEKKKRKKNPERNIFLLSIQKERRLAVVKTRS